MMHVAHLIVHSFVGGGTHNGLYPMPPAPAPVPMPLQAHISASTFLGYITGANFSTSVLGPFGIPLVGKGNDSGYIVPHISVTPHPGNLLVPLIIAFGSSKPMFSASTVKMGGTTGGGASDGPVAANPIPFSFTSLNQGCNDPCNYPGDMVICPNSVFVGLTLGDMIAGVVGSIIDTATSAVANFLGGKAGTWIMKNVAGPLAARIVREFCDELVEKFGKEAVEKMLREAVEKTLQSPLGQFVEEYFGKVSETVIGKVIEFVINAPTQIVVGEGRADTMGKVVDGAVDRASEALSSEPQSSTSQGGRPTEATAPLSNDHPGAPPIHNAE